MADEYHLQDCRVNLTRSVDDSDRIACAADRKAGVS
jgi:hypothetical protein